jgi:hypothetical protein
MEVEHMVNMWKNIGAKYRQLKGNPPTNQVELCGCINNYLTDDIVQQLNKYALKARAGNRQCNKPHTTIFNSILF